MQFKAVFPIQSIFLSHICDKNLPTESQHGFVKGKSSVSALTALVEDITDMIEEDNHVISFFIDLSKAFDCLGHNLILEKLYSLGIRESSLKWF